MRIRSGFFAALAALLLSACAGSGPLHSELKSTYAPIPADQGRIFFYRNSSMFGAAIQPDVRLNGDVVGTSKPGGFFYKDVKAGNQTVSTTTEVERQLTFTLAAREVRYVRTSPSLGLLVGRVQAELVPTEEAERELASLHHTPYTPEKK